MKLNVEFEEDLMRQYNERGANPVFVIYWTHNGTAYPEEGWIDFGSVVLSWWLVAAASLLNGSRMEEFLFMDGPYQLDVRAINDVYHVSGSGSDFDWRVPRETFVRELLVAAERVSRKLGEFAIPDEAGLEQGIRTLEIAASAQKTRAVHRQEKVSVIR